MRRAPLQRARAARPRRAAERDGVPDPGARFSALQNAAGNRAVAGLLQRQVDAPPKPFLGSGQAATAVSFYRGKPDLYPEDVVLKIQKAVKSPESGVADEAMVQGVARFQTENVLKVDGMAGPRTLPRLFQSGLAAEADRKEFVAVGKDVEKNWATLATPEARADALFAGVKAELDREKVPTPDHAVGDLNGPAGVFVGRDWRMTFDRAALSAATITDDDARSVAGTVYHEARHAEQQHKMARMWAARGKTAAEIQLKLPIPDRVAKDAFDDPLPEGIEFTVAAEQWDSEFGDGKAHFEQAEKEAPTLADLRGAQAEAAANPTPQTRAKAARLLAAFKAYHDLPAENDAFATEGDLELTWDEATPTP